METRFWSKVDASASCWVWIAASAGKGYGKYTTKIDGRWTYPYAHRYAWESLVGPIPEGMILDHLCKNRKCVNPDHLEVVTYQDNNLRGAGIARANADKMHCPSGHPYDNENTYVYRGGRMCKACQSGGRNGS